MQNTHETVRLFLFTVVALVPFAPLVRAQTRAEITINDTGQLAGPRNLSQCPYANRAYSAMAWSRIGTSESASFHSVRKSW
jgi:hypothetical protein